jgi:lipopolysaccharide heptosyltransferase I
MKTPQRFLITRLSAFGDCVQTLPLLCALRDAFPEANITWMTQTQFVPVLKRHSDVDHVISVSRRWFLSPTEFWQVSRQLRAMNFDVVLDPQSLTKSAIGGFLSGARRRIGVDRPAGRELSRHLNNELVSDRTNVIHRYLELLRPLGIEESRINFRFPVLPLSSRLIGFICSAGGAGNFVVLNPNAGWPSKTWPAEQVAETAEALYSLFKLRSVVIWHGTKERQVAECVAACHSSVLVAPPTDMNELAALIRASRLFVGTDSGPLHLAAANGTPCVGLFGPTRSEVCGPISSSSVCIQAPLQTTRKRNAPNTAMQTIDTNMVVEACSKLLRNEGHDVGLSGPFRPDVHLGEPLERAA